MFADLPLQEYKSLINQLHDDVLNILITDANIFVPRVRKNFYKYWWDQEADDVKTASIESNRIWKAAGRPKHGPIFDKQQSCRLQYRRKIREGQRSGDCQYSNELHEALLKKNGAVFWNCWRSKFETSSSCTEVDGYVDSNIVVDKFREHFRKSYSANNELRAAQLRHEFMQLRENYSGFPSTLNSGFDVEIVSNVIAGLSHGKAAGLDGLTAEHLLNSHPIISCVLAKLFNLILQYRCVPDGFCYQLYCSFA